MSCSLAGQFWSSPMCQAGQRAGKGHSESPQRVLLDGTFSAESRGHRNRLFVAAEALACPYRWEIFGDSYAMGPAALDTGVVSCSVSLSRCVPVSHRMSIPAAVLRCV